LSIISFAQEKKKNCSCAFRSLFNLGILEGEKGSEFHLQTIQGLRFGKWFTGIGAGLDYYQARTIPLFVDIRREFFNKKNAPFIYADGGYNFAWPTKDDKEHYGIKIKYDGGLYYDVGLGYRITAGKQAAFLLSAGYSYKFLREKRFNPVCVTYPCYSVMYLENEWFTYDLNRLSIKVGMQL
jgi:hypothetical protein